MRTLKLVLRNSLASPRRAAFVIANILCGVVLVVLIDGYATSMFRGMRDGMIQSGLGHAQIFAQGLQTRGNLQSVSVLIPAETAAGVLAALKAQPGVRVATPRVETSVMASNGEFSQVGQMIGVDPDTSALVSSGLRITAGRDLFEDDSNGILLGVGLANALGFKPGDTVTLLGSTVDNTLNGIDLEVIGLVSTGVRESDARLMYVTLETAQTFLMTDGITRIAVLLEDTDATETFVDDTAAVLSDGLEIQGWRTLAPTYSEVVDLFSTIFLVIKAAIGLFVVLAVANTIAICVVERTREIGIARAIGDQRLEIARQYALEGVLLGIVGSMLGMGMALGLAELLSNSGLNMPTPPGSTVDYPLRFIVTGPNLTLAGVLAVLVAFVASLLPAIKAANTSIVGALRHV
ncbi:FtsX-like permease family protein [Pseudomonas sp. Irchel s3b6]|uniref:ABC transporter permease n=1 Tax=Pseudomonas sp. Irchel s3b6 TaxID=2009078 RepID=UPI000BA41FF2|nr:FtsX-like permease family protein [Pseudomonas sp. Irchel s3b6]